MTAYFPTQDEIAAQLRAASERDPLGFETGSYLDWLDFEHARPFLKDGVIAEKWADLQRPFEPTRERVIREIVEYMPFAWGKANDCRGISAWRSLAHAKAWLWLLGGAERAAARELDDYTFYGKPQLRAICERFGVDWSALDDGEWRSSEGGPAARPLPAAPIFDPKRPEGAGQ